MQRRPISPAPLAADDHSQVVAAQALAARLSSLYEASIALQQRVGADELLQALGRQARWLLDFQYCAVLLRAADGYRRVVLRGEPLAERGPTETERRALDARHPLLLAQAAPGTPAGMQSALLLPLLAGDEALGVLAFYHPEAKHYRLDDVRIAGALALHLALLLRNAELFDAAGRARDELHTVLESIGDAVLVLDESARVLLANRAMCALVGLPSEALVGRRALRLLRGTGGCPALVERAGRRAIAFAWRTSPGGASAKGQLADGRWIEWASAALAGERAGYVVTMRDISERVSLEELREDMARMLVHDLRTPLTSILMGLDFLQRPGLSSDASERSELIALTQSAAVQMLGQVNTILDMSKLEAGKLTLDLAPTPLHVLVEQAVRTVQPIAQQQRISIAVHAAPGLSAVLADPTLLRRVFENIVGNAIKWSPSDSAVAVELVAASAAVEVRVRDAGPGVPAELRERIFEKYGGATRRERRAGTGLGLAFCKLVVDAHGGRIGVRPAPGGGSEFWFQLPLH
jgi:PAS domain S-box-containing protein